MVLTICWVPRTKHVLTAFSLSLSENQVKKTQCYFCFYFKEEEIEAEKINKLVKVTELMTDGAGI